MTNEMHDWAMLILRYKDVDYTVAGYHMPAAVLARKEFMIKSTADVVKEHDDLESERMHLSIHRRLEQIYRDVIVLQDIMAIIKIGESKKSIIDITRMFG